MQTKKGKKEEKPIANLTPYEDQERVRADYLITKAIFKRKVDHTHLLAFGYGSEYFSLKIGSSSYDYLANGSNVA